MDLPLFLIENKEIYKYYKLKNALLSRKLSYKYVIRKNS